jgi:hypothetical protein
MLFATVIGGRLKWQRAKLGVNERPGLKLPDLEQSKSAVLNGLTSPSSPRTYDHALREFMISSTRPAEFHYR